MIRTMYLKWAVRHRNKINYALHLIGIPLTVAAIPLLITVSVSAAALALVGGYALQFAGHVVEGNKAGEQLLIERLIASVRRP